jgi:hypothetical protein
MMTLMNVLKTPNPRTDSISKTNPQTHAPLCCLSNGFTKVQAEPCGTKNNKTEIKINAKISSVSVEAFIQWKKSIANLLNKETTSRIEAEIISLANGGSFKFEQYMPYYSLLVFEHALCGDFNISKFLNQSDIAINLELTTSNKCGQILDSLHNLESSKISYQGKLVAKDYHPESTAYIPATYFKFPDQKIVSFVAYNGPVTFVNPLGSIKKGRINKQIQEKSILKSTF